MRDPPILFGRPPSRPRLAGRPACWTAGEGKGRTAFAFPFPWPFPFAVVSLWPSSPPPPLPVRSRYRRARLRRSDPATLERPNWLGRWEGRCGGEGAADCDDARPSSDSSTRGWARLALTGGGSSAPGLLCLVATFSPSRADPYVSVSSACRSFSRSSRALFPPSPFDSPHSQLRDAVSRHQLMQFVVVAPAAFARRGGRRRWGWGRVTDAWKMIVGSLT